MYESSDIRIFSISKKKKMKDNKFDYSMKYGRLFNHIFSFLNYYRLLLDLINKYDFIKKKIQKANFKIEFDRGILFSCFCFVQVIFLF